ncbi:MAG: cyclic nucleotide-binding domain-containing protein [Roseinatronobacter sp.]
MERIALDAGSILIRAETQSGDVYFLESGRLSVQLPTASGTPKRLSSLAPGAVVGEVARYRDRRRTADVVAEEPSIVYCLTQDTFVRLEQEDRDLAALVHAILATALAEKVVRTSRNFATM